MRRGPLNDEDGDFAVDDGGGVRIASGGASARDVCSSANIPASARASAVLSLPPPPSHSHDLKPVQNRNRQQSCNYASFKRSGKGGDGEKGTEET